MATVDTQAGQAVGHLRATIIGAIGGCLAGLLTNPISLLDQWTTPHASLAAWQAGLVLRVGLMTLFGGLVAYLYDETQKLKALQLGATAPAALAALLMVSNIRELEDPAGVSKKNPVVAGFLGQTLQPPAVEAAQAGTPQPGGADTAQVRAQAEELVTLFPGSSRRDASAALIGLYGKAPDAVVDVLISNMQAPTNYRINLYVAYTLARIPGGWAGTEQQRRAVETLKSSPNFGDETFSRWVSGALANWRPRST